MAEAVFQDQIRKMDLIDFWEVESAALLSYHVGNDPEPRATATLQKAGITDYSHIARKVNVKLNKQLKAEIIKTDIKGRML